MVPGLTIFYAGAGCAQLHVVMNRTDLPDSAVLTRSLPQEVRLPGKPGTFATPDVKRE